MDLVETGCGGVDWSGLDRNKEKWRNFINAAMDFRIL
jgi:hypothetical protein